MGDRLQSLSNPRHQTLGAVLVDHVLSCLTATFFGLLAYMVFGAIALKRGKKKAVRLGFFALAVLAYGYIVSVALSRSPYIAF